MHHKAPKPLPPDKCIQIDWILKFKLFSFPLFPFSSPDTSQTPKLLALTVLVSEDTLP